MVNIKTPARPVHRYGKWPPKNSKEYKLKFDDNWWIVARHHRMDVWDLIAFNFETRVPEEVNWYMRELIGCKVSFDGLNYSFVDADKSKNKIYVPIGAGPAPVPDPKPKKKDFDQILQDLWIESVNSRDPRQNRFECILSTLQQGVDDRVIFWSHIAPDEKTPFPAHLIKGRDIGTRNSAVEPKWFFDNIKSAADVDRQPTGVGIGVGNMFVTSLRKAFVTLQPDLLMFRGFHDHIIETHQSLEKWADVSDGGSSSMPREYRAVKDWVSRQTNNPKSVLNCVIAAGS